MTAEDRESRLSAIFHAVVDLPEPEREAALDRLCGDDGELRRDVEELVREDSAGTLSVLRGNAHRPAELPLERVGPFRLLEVLGEGGMGVVYLAEQEHPRRRVALKMIRFGLQTDEVAARFERERQALARMNHPGIAEIYESGVSEAGRPYFAMEYVPGRPVTSACDAVRMSIERRVRLFVEVCDAVEHAHRNGILHRDLKPSNVLVKHEDGVPRVKIIDFGVAAALAGTLGLEDYRTTLGRVVGTYLYMSPEQADAEADLDARSDVYSLGTMLYELLAGASPYPDEALAAGDPATLQSALLDSVPRAPSTRVLRGPGSRPAEARGESTQGLARRLRGELDWIVLRALEKDRERRYGSAAALRDDLHRYLEEQPVLAGPPSTAYRVHRFVRRHRRMVAAGVLSGVSLVVALVATTLAWRNARAALEAERARANEVTRSALVTQARVEYFEHALFDAPPGSEVRRGLELLLDYAVADVPILFGTRPDAEAAVRTTAGRGYLLVDRPEKAREELLRAYAIRTGTLGQDDLEVFLVLESLIRATRLSQGVEAAAPYVEHSLALARRLASGDPELGEVLEELDRSRAGGHVEAESRLTELVVHLLQKDAGGKVEGLLLGRAIVEAGLAHLETGELNETVLYLEQLEELAGKALPRGSRAHLMFLRNLASKYLQANRRLAPQALTLAQRLTDEAEKMLPTSHWVHADALRLQGVALAALGPEHEAEAEAALLEAEERSDYPLSPGLAAWASEQEQAGTLDAFLGRSWERWCAGERDSGWWPRTHADLDAQVTARVSAFLAERERAGDPFVGEALASERAEPVDGG